MATATALARYHSIRGTIDYRRQRLNFATCEVVELFFLNAKDPFVGTEPKVTLAVLEDAIDNIVQQSISRAVSGEPPVLQTIQSAAVRTDPENAITIFID